MRPQGINRTPTLYLWWPACLHRIVCWPSRAAGDRYPMSAIAALCSGLGPPVSRASSISAIADGTSSVGILRNHLPPCGTGQERVDLQGRDVFDSRTAEARVRLQAWMQFARARASGAGGRCGEPIQGCRCAAICATAIPYNRTAAGTNTRKRWHRKTPATRPTRQAIGRCLVSGALQTRSESQTTMPGNSCLAPADGDTRCVGQYRGAERPGRRCSGRPATTLR